MSYNNTMKLNCTVETLEDGRAKLVVYPCQHNTAIKITHVFPDMATLDRHIDKATTGMVYDGYF